MWFLTLDLATLLIQFWLFPPIFGSIKIELSGNTIWPQASGLQKFAKLNGYVNFFQLKNYMNETFSVIFKHRVRILELKI